jgi:hypothetical protein
MPRPIKIKIDVTKLDKEAFFRAPSGSVYVDIVAWPSKSSRFGETHSLKQQFPKDDPRNQGSPYVGSLTLPDNDELPM